MMKFFLLIFTLLGMLPLRAFSSDSIRISLLTCAPGTEIYALFGHTAIRYENFSKQQDWAYNYGMFSFREPNFVWRFVKGETDYQLGRIPFHYFEAEYAMRGSAVYQQVLNLTGAEKRTLVNLLEENFRPENRIYRYNYFYDNCTTRARDKVEECLSGSIVYPDAVRPSSFREIVHEYTAGNDWSELGIDLCLGAEADASIGLRKQMFAPFYTKEAFRSAMIQRGNTLVPLVLEEFKVVDVDRDEEEKPLLSPWVCGLLLLLVTCMVIGWSIYRKRWWWVWDFFLFGLQGIGGVVIAFLFFFSVHPTVSSNWMLMLFHPVPLFYLPWMIYKDIKGQKDGYHWVNAICLTSFMVLMPFLQQKFNPTVLPLALSLLLTSVGHLYIYYKKGL